MTDSKAWDLGTAAGPQRPPSPTVFSRDLTPEQAAQLLRLLGPSAGEVKPIQPLPATPAFVYTPPADTQLIAEAARLHAVVGRLREAWAVTVGELDQMAEDDEAVTDDDVKAMDARFIAIFRSYEEQR